MIVHRPPVSAARRTITIACVLLFAAPAALMGAGAQTCLRGRRDGDKDEEPPPPSGEPPSEHDDAFAGALLRTRWDVPVWIPSTPGRRS